MRYTSKGWIVLLFLVAKLCLTLLWPHVLQPTCLLCPWDSPGKNTGVGCNFLLQGIFPTQGLDLCLLHWRADSLPLTHQGSPRGECRPTKEKRKWSEIKQWWIVNSVMMGKGREVKKEMGGVGWSSCWRCLGKTPGKGRRNERRNVLGSRGHMCWSSEAARTSDSRTWRPPGARVRWERVLVVVLKCLSVSLLEMETNFRP